MKTVFIGLLFLHGIIHFIGTARAYQWIRKPELPDAKNYTKGTLWLLTGIMLMTAALLLLLGISQWLYVFMLALLISSIMIVTEWKDARAGMIGNAVLFVLGTVEASTERFEQRFRTDIATVNPVTVKAVTVTENALQALPPVVARYLRVSNSLGQPIPEYFKVIMTGKIRKKDDADWMTIRSEQYNDLRNGSRFFYLKSSKMGLPVVGYHRMKQGHASMDVRMAAMVPVAKESGAEMDRAETVTFFNDMCCMAPASLLDSRIEWLAASDSTALARFSLNNKTIEATLYFREDGMLSDFKSNDRLNADAGLRLPWSTPLQDPGAVGPYRLNRKARAIFKYPDGPFCYAEFHIDSVEINPLSIR